jgi:hypothetical protein
MKRYHCSRFLLKLKLRWGLLADPFQVLVQFHQLTRSLAHIRSDDHISAIELIRSRASLLDYDLLHVGQLIYGQPYPLSGISTSATSAALIEGVFGAPA